MRSLLQRVLLPVLLLALTAPAATAAPLPEAVRGLVDGILPGVLPTPATAPADPARPPAVPGAGRVRFGIYPGGGVGTVDAPALPVAEDRERRLALLQELRAGRPFVAHDYVALDGTGARLQGDLEWVRQELDAYRDAGIGLELVLRFRPSSRRAGPAVRAYVREVERVVRTVGRHPALVGLQITNEANLPDAPDAGDGAYPGAARALVRGVVAADRAARRLGRPRLPVGFNVAHGAPGSPSRFWRALRRHGGRSFARAVDWVGVDVYPGTWSGPKDPTAAQVRGHVTGALTALRRVRLPQAGLGRRVALHVTETGFPTGPGRSDLDQVRVMTATVAAVAAASRRLRVTDFRWFDLRDADSASRHVEHQYGVVRSDFSRKPGFDVLQALVGRLGR